MPEAAVAAAPAAGAQGGQQQRQGGGILGTVMRMALMWYMMQWFKGSGQQGAGKGGTVPVANPLYRKGDLLDMYVYLSEDQYLHDRSTAQLLWEQRDVGLATAEERLLETTYSPSRALKNNGSLFVHVYFARASVDPDTPSDELPPNSLWSRSHSLVAYMPPPKNKTGMNLLSGEKQEPVQQPQDEGPVEWVSYWKPNVTIGMLDHFNAYPLNQIPPQLRPHFHLNGENNYFPLIAFEEFWLLRDKYIPLNETVQELPLYVCIKTSNWWFFQLQNQMEQSFALQRSTGLTSEGESDEIKRIFLEGNPYLLALTMVVSLLHTVFDFMAFKNDIGFWKDNKSMEGLSARTILINAACQLIVMLYLFDNETSMVVLFSSVVGTAIEFWKVTKAMDVSIDTRRFPFIHIKDKASYSRSNTKQYDADATRYLSYALYPLVIGYAIYALVYETHKSWYSWVLNSLVGAVYTFGFILMCPQLYLNYKLKSVAHLPWRQMTYKFLNTIIDDLFAFVIKMPTLHRLSVFRDDVIFLIYLYQRWIYRVDPTRVNEFGYSQAQEEEMRAKRLADGQAEPAAAEQAGEGSRRRDATQALPAADDTPVVNGDSKKSK